MPKKQDSWQEELLFELKTCLHFYRLCEEALREWGQVVIESSLVKHAPKPQCPNPKKALRQSKNATGLNIPKLAYQYFQAEPLGISGISYGTAPCLLTTMGRDLHRFPTAKSFASWLRLIPNIGKRRRWYQQPHAVRYVLFGDSASLGGQFHRVARRSMIFTPFFKRGASRKGE